jgi:hypothetical protein
MRDPAYLLGIPLLRWQGLDTRYPPIGALFGPTDRSGPARGAVPDADLDLISGHGPVS